MKWLMDGDFPGTPRRYMGAVDVRIVATSGSLAALGLLKHQHKKAA